MEMAGGWVRLRPEFLTARSFLTADDVGRFCFHVPEMHVTQCVLISQSMAAAAAGTIYEEESADYLFNVHFLFLYFASINKAKANKQKQVYFRSHSHSPCTLVISNHIPSI